MSRWTTAFSRQGIATWAIALVFAGTLGSGSTVVLWLLALGVPVARMGDPLERVFICSLPFAALFLWALRAVSKAHVFARRVTITFFVWLELLLLLLPPSAVRLGLLSPTYLSAQNTLAVTAIFAVLSLLAYMPALQVARKRQAPAGSASQL